MFFLLVCLQSGRFAPSGRADGGGCTLTICPSAARISQVGTPDDRSRAQQRFFLPFFETKSPASSTPKVILPHTYQTSLNTKLLSSKWLASLPPSPAPSPPSRRPRSRCVSLHVCPSPVHLLSHALARTFTLLPATRVTVFFKVFRRFGEKTK